MGTQHRGWEREALDHAHYQAHGFTPTPRLVQWMVTQSCGLACPHCLSASASPLAELTLAEIEPFLDEVAAMGVPELLLTGGEPLDRPDLPAILALIRKRRIPWSLNTARMPGPEVRRAMRAWPPGFAAVSLDGPEAVHDAFRGRPGAFTEATEALRFFDGITDGQCAAGTTVTHVNFPHLDQTFALVKRLGVRAWGLHLVVPEGRARHRRDLLLEPREVRELLCFIAEARKAFPVSMADEIGFVGDFEPLVREGGFFCGAGRTQCVVLADGAVVPCSTADRSASVGTIRGQRLADLWREGFAEMRPLVLGEKCAACTYVAACSGGCWLQRRHGQHCFRPSWEGSPTRRSMAALAASAALATFTPHPLPVAQAAASKPHPAAKPSTKRPIELVLLRWLAGLDARRVCATRIPAWLVKMVPSTDPLHAYLKALSQPACAPDLAATCRRVQSALSTRIPSLSVLALLHRDLGEAILDGPTEREPNLAEVLAQVLSELDKAALAWRQAAWDQQTDPFLTPATSPLHEPGWCMRSKAGCRPDRLSGDRVRELVRKRRWSVGGAQTITAAHIAAHVLGESEALRFFPIGDTAGMILSRQGSRAIRGKDTLGLFERLATSSHARFVVALPDGPRLTVALPAEREVTYFDVVRALYEQHRQAFRTVANGRSASRTHMLFIPAYRSGKRNQSGDVAWSWLF